MLHEAIRGLREYLDGRINDTNTRIDANFRWMLGIQIAMWITIISAILLH